MKAIKSLVDTDLSVDFNGWTFELPKKKAVLVGEDLYKHLQDNYTLAFDFEYKGKEQLTKIKSTQTPVRFQTPITAQGKDMFAGLPNRPKMMFNAVDQLPTNGNLDKDGVEWTEDIETTGGTK